MKLLQIEGARALADAAAINHVRIVANAKGLFVEINRSFTVANRIKQPRYFAKADTCFTWLRDIGVGTVNEVDLTDWGISQKQPVPALSKVLTICKFALSGAEWVRLSNKAESLSQKGKHAEAMIEARQALQMAEDELAPDHPDLAMLLNSLATQHYALGQFADAEPLYKRALDIAEKSFSLDDPFIGRYLNNLAETCDALGKSEQTEGMYLRALAICEKDSDADRSEVATILTNLASLYSRQANYGQAEPLYKKAQEIWDDYSGWLGGKHPNTVLTLEGLAMLYRKTGRDKQAAKLENRAAAMRARKT